MSTDFICFRDCVLASRQAYIILLTYTNAEGTKLRSSSKVVNSRGQWSWQDQHFAEVLRR